MNTNIYQTVTDRILKQLKAGVVPWRKTWTTGLPKSLTTGKEYRGVNVLILGSAEFTSRYWVTYREAQRLGGHVHKGETARHVICWKWRTPEELARCRKETRREDVALCVAFGHAVFNLDQVEGVSRPADDVPKRLNESRENARRVWDAMPDKPKIIHTATLDPTYRAALDQVILPHPDQFQIPEEYLATFFHELTHSTGHPKRLNRWTLSESIRFEEYSFEELVAEFGAAFLCALAGIRNLGTEALQASYIDSWSQAFEKDQRLIVRAASAAQRAADYIRGNRPTQPSVDATDQATPAELPDLEQPALHPALA